MRDTAIIAELRTQIAQIEGVGRRHPAIPFGISEIDERLPGNGLATGVLHGIAGGPDIADDASATIFLAGILARVDGPVLWCLRWRDLFAPSLHLAGLHPDRLIHVEAGRDANVLLAMEECLRHPGLAGVVGELARYSTTASKRLQLAAEGSGVEYSCESALAFQVTALEQFIGSLRDHKPRIFAMLLQKQVGAGPYFAILDHLVAASLNYRRRILTAMYPASFDILQVLDRG